MVVYGMVVEFVMELKNIYGRKYNLILIKLKYRLCLANGDISRKYRATLPRGTAQCECNGGRLPLGWWMSYKQRKRSCQSFPKSLSNVLPK
uniref:Uncharacterized protein n=1 Tax=Magallana gigas TaxID=29159 RepID=K1QKZ2_MAGGI